MANGLGPGFRQGISSLAGAITERKQRTREEEKLATTRESTLATFDELATNIKNTTDPSRLESVVSNLDLGRAIIERDGSIDDALRTIGANISTQEKLGTFQTPETKFKQTQELRRGRREERLLRQEKLSNVGTFGASVTTQEIEDFKTDFGVDLDSTIEAFGIPAKINKQTGERSYNIPPQKILSVQAGERKVTPAEEEFFSDNFEAVDTMQEVLDGLADLGITDLTGIIKIIPETLSSELGPFSFPAKFQIVGQFAKDPRYTALKSKLERTFQKYRKIITGAQASNRELKTLRPLISAFTDRPEVFFANSRSLIAEGNRSTDTRLELMDAIGRDTTGLQTLVGKRRGRVAKKEEKISRQGQITPEQARAELERRGLL